MKKNARSLIIAVLGHVDHGKTTLVDKIRGTYVASRESGGITQMLGCTMIPMSSVENICGDLIKKIDVKTEIPGFLWIDCPGHSAFASMRKRGGSIADLAILVVDINEGFKPQTDESIKFLRKFKTPFIVAATKIDRIHGWVNQEKNFLESLINQSDFVKKEFENKIYGLVSQLIERDFCSDRYDKIKDFKKDIAIVPCSGVTGEGIQDLLMVLIGLAQQFLKPEFNKLGFGKGIILEVKEIKGLGKVLDIILYDGTIKIGDYLIIGNKDMTVTKIKSMLVPTSMKEMATEKKFKSVKEICAAAAVRVSAPNLDGAVSGLHILTTKDNVEKAKIELKSEISITKIHKNIEGVALKSDSIGGIEALIKMAKENEISIRSVDIKHITRNDIVKMKMVKNKYNRSILSFNLNVSSDIEEFAKECDVKIFYSNVIYKLFDDYKKWKEIEIEKQRKIKLAKLVWPAKIKFLPNCTFRKNDPAIIGIEIISGKIKTKVSIMKTDGKMIGNIKKIQKEGKSIEKAEIGDKVAISIANTIVGKHINESDIFYVYVPKHDLNCILEEFKEDLSEEDIQTIKEFKNIKYPMF